MLVWAIMDLSNKYNRTVVASVRDQDHAITSKITSIIMSIDETTLATTEIPSIEIPSTETNLIDH